MNRQEAIKILKIAKAEVEWEYPMDYQIALDLAISSLETDEAYQLEYEKAEVIPLDKVLEILGDYKLRIPPTVYYELKGDLVDYEEQGEDT